MRRVLSSTPGMNEIKQDLAKKGKLLDIKNHDDCLAVACFLHELRFNCSMVYENPDNTDPYAPISEDQYTPIHQMLRKVLIQNDRIRFSESDFSGLFRNIDALMIGLLGIGLWEKLIDLDDKNQ